MKKVVFGILLFISCSSFAQEEAFPKTQGISFAFNHFPVLYLEPFTGDFNGIWYGYHLGYFHQFKKLNIRGGINFNSWRNGIDRQNRITTIGFELGFEYPLLKPERKWLVNPAINIWIGDQWASHYSPFTSRDYQFYMIGPDLLVGRKIGTRWIITSETSIGIGRVGFADDGRLNLQEGVNIDLAKFLGLGFRYCFN